jgi:hypothetical protein
MSSGFEIARKVANAVLYEGYLLYPYRASARKNQVRWQFGVLVPHTQAEAGWPEAWFQQTELLIEPQEEVRLHGIVRFLQVEARQVEAMDDAGFRPVEVLEVPGRQWLSFDEGIEQEVAFSVPVLDLVEGERVVRFDVPGGEQEEEIRWEDRRVGRIVRRRRALMGLVRLQAEPLAGPHRAYRVRVRLENATPWCEPGADRTEVLRHSFVASHTLFRLEGGAFLSLLEPPEWAKEAATACQNLHTFPVLVGEAGRRDLLLSSPIILYDYPVVAPESPADLFDATEIDELLTLRTLTLTEEEKEEARATDPRAAAIIDRVEAFPPDVLERLHGAVRYLREVTEHPPRSPIWAPWFDPSVNPETDAVEIGGVRVARGSRVRLRPRPARADAQDMFLAGRLAQVEAVFFDVDGKTYIAVTLEDDPIADLKRETGRYLYFDPEEVEPLP